MELCRCERAARLLLLAVLVASAPGVASAIEAGSVDDFEDMTTQGWGSAVFGSSNPTPPQNIADPEDAMNRILNIRSSGAGTAGSRLVGLGLGIQWDGDYPAAGVVAIELDAINLGSTDLFLRVALVTISLEALVSAIALELPAAGPQETAQWVTHEFSLDLADLDCEGSCDAEFVLGNVEELRILSSAAGMTKKGDRIAASVGIDLISAVPEPASALQGAAALAALALLARAPRSRCRWRRSPG